MSDVVLEIESLLRQDEPSSWVTYYWDQWNKQRQGKLAEWLELDKYLFATDTTTTANSSLPWKNTTTNPKLCQIRDNLHSNYISALFPNDKWLEWEGFDKDSSTLNKSKIITSYMRNKTDKNNFYSVMDKLLYDYIDCGNAFVGTTFEERYKKSPDGTYVKEYVGPVSYRISPYDIVFNPLASNFEHTPKIIRSIKTIGELYKLASTNPDQSFWEKAINRRNRIKSSIAQYTADDVYKAEQYQVDGFGNLYEYYMSDYIEVLEFYGDYHNPKTDELKLNQIITVIDRAEVVRNIDIPTYSGIAPIHHVGWRTRKDNLWAMGPLDNLVGMQYRLDHLQNSKSDAIDLAIMPPLKINGDVEAFEWGPMAEIHITGDGDVSELNMNLQSILGARSEEKDIEDHMELYAGAPREAMGIRTPGEKTAFEVQQLFNAAGRIFQEKTINFERNLLEPALNDELEEAHRHFDGKDTIIIIDNDIGVKQFEDISKEDITANGILKPLGARHFGQKQQELQSLMSILNNQVLSILQPHISSINLAKYIDDSLGIAGYKIFQPNIAISENAATQKLAGQMQEDQMVSNRVRSDGSIMPDATK